LKEGVFHQSRYFTIGVVLRNQSIKVIFHLKLSVEMSAPQPEGRINENTSNEYSEFDPKAKEPSEKEIKLAKDQRLQLLPDNEQEEKEEILLTVPTELTKPKSKPKSQSKSRSSKIKTKSSRRKQDEISSVLSKQMGRQTMQIDKIGLLLRTVQSQIKQLQSQLSQIQKIMTKRNFPTSSTPLRKKGRR
jgi:hypothetical protein